MILQLSVTIPTRPVKGVQAETNLDPAQVGWPDSISGKLLGFQIEDWVGLGLFERTEAGTVTVRQDVNVGFKGKRYKFSRLESDGTFELKKDW